MGGKHDQASRRRAKRAGRETGCWIYIPGEQLARAGIEGAPSPVFYRTWDGRRRTILVQLYAEP